MNLLRAHLEREYPNEGCGFLAGEAVQDGAARVYRHIAVENQRLDDGPAGRRRYLIAPDDFLRVERELDSDGLVLLGTYHSHPDVAARPSEYDRDHAWPWYRYLIVSVVRGEAREARVWELSPDREAFVEHALTIED